MCGIAGYWGSLPPKLNLREECLRLMSHRGPNANGHKLIEGKNGNKIVFLHTRLSIIDLSNRANQPYETKNGILTYNGEIYNYKRIRDLLLSDGVVLNTKSDTEVLAEAIAAWGIDKFLEVAEGMWAFAYYDKLNGDLIICRDRFGEKPLYTMRERGAIYFGSEPKFIKTLSNHKLTPNYNQINRYLVNGYKALYKHNECFYQEIDEIPSGNYLLLKADGASYTRKYWKPRSRIVQDISFDDASLIVKEKLVKAVGLRLESDVPVAFCMSGGVDSNSLIAIAKKIFDYDVHGFTIINNDPRYYEKETLDFAVAELGVRHTPIELDPANFLSNLKLLVKAHDAPVYTISYYIHWLLMKSVSVYGYKVSISGTGADEIFSGYYDHHNFYLAEFFHDKSIYNEALRAWFEKIKPLVRNPYLSNANIFHQNPDMRDHIYLDRELFSSALYAPWNEDFCENIYTTDKLRNRMMNEMFDEVVPVILHEDDANSMFFSIENRSPFLDVDLFETVYSMPSRFLIQNGYTKALLRSAMRDIVPEAVLKNYRKIGFNAPLLELLNISDPMVAEEIFEDSPIWNLVRRDIVKEWLRKKHLSNSESKFLFNVINAKIFLEECLG